MVGPSPILRYRFLFDAALVVASFIVGLVGGGFVSLGVILALLVAAVSRTYVEYQETKVQPASQELQTVLEEEVFPRLEEEYNSCIEDPPDIRINVMIARRRNIAFWRRDRSIPLRERTLKTEAWMGDYESNRETELEWRQFEGIAGAAMNDNAQEAWSDLDSENVNVQTEWNLTDTQIYRTEHLNSVLSVPIYLPDDDAKERPVGVLNIDSRANLADTRFDSDLVRDITIYYANLIGAIIR